MEYSILDKLKKIEIFDVSGKSCFLKTSNFLDPQINISSLSKGIYTVKVVDEKKSLQSKLVVYWFKVLDYIFSIDIRYLLWYQLKH